MPIFLFGELNGVHGIVKDITERKKEEQECNKEISKTLLISQRSLEYNLTELFQKLNVNSRVEAIKKAKGLGILPTEDLY
ncbi:LuxR C-terminal-related transcriptional regulator [Bacillus salipaludis]|uniref:LuxR C-terminal-related transcriptional regulator n=1 Tax=Bacillus salipaludis TaxID=2547811 RepID=A0ABW8RCZ9_9BACI